MCQGSIHVPHRMAGKKEQLVLQKVPDHMGLKGYYSVDPDRLNNKLVCVRGTVKAMMRRVKFELGLPFKLIKEWQGKRNVAVTLRHNREGSDTVIFPDGREVALFNLWAGTRLDIGMPVEPKKVKGMKMIERSVREALALPSDPKEGEEGEQPAAPAAEPVAEPATEPAPAEAPVEPGEPEKVVA